MALSQSNLKSALKAVLDANYEAEKAAEEYAKAYYDYARVATFGTNAPVAAGLPNRRDGLKGTLFTAIQNPLIGLPATFATAWANGIITFWTNVPVAGPTQTGNTTTPPTSAAASLTTVFSNLANTTEMCAEGMAAALHTATTAVQATVTPPNGTVLPIA